MIRTTIIAAIMLLGGCQTSGLSLDVEKALFVARSTHANVCEQVEENHALGTLTGARFNTARDACIDADDALDAADQFASVGDVRDASSAISAAIVILMAVREEVQ